MLHRLVWSLVVVMFTLMRDVTVHWIHWRHLSKLIVLLVERHGWMMVSVRNGNANVLRHLELSSLANLVEGLYWNMRHAASWTVAKGLRWHEGMVRRLFLFVGLLLAFL